MAVSFRYAVHTDLGTVRTNNEDSAFASPRLLVLADGMGGHAAGEVASAVALRVFAEVDQTSGAELAAEFPRAGRLARDRKSTRLNSSHVAISDAVFCLQKKFV